MAPTATSLAPTLTRQPIPVTLTPIAAPPSIGEDSVMPTTDLAPVREGFSFSFFLFLVFTFNLVSTPPMAPVPDDGIIFFFGLLFYFNFWC